jgi:8-oxo-dGTP diphosphatase
MNNKLIEVACWVHVHDNRLLLIESRKSPGAYYMPGGKIETGETREEALLREINEELNVTLQPGSVRYFGSFRAQAFNQPAGVEVSDHCYFADFSGTPVASAEVQDVRYFTHGEYLKLPLQAPAVLLIFDALRQEGWLS